MQLDLVRRGGPVPVTGALQSEILFASLAGYGVPIHGPRRKLALPRVQGRRPPPSLLNGRDQDDRGQITRDGHFLRLHPHSTRS